MPAFSGNNFDQFFLHGSEGADHFVLSNFGDEAIGNGGDDDMQGGTNPDLIFSDDGNDFIEGGGAFYSQVLANEIITIQQDGVTFTEGIAIGDILSGGAGDDIIFAGTAADITTSFDTGAVAQPHRGDWIGGGTGDDHIYGGNANDALPKNNSGVRALYNPVAGAGE